MKVALWCALGFFILCIGLGILMHYKRVEQLGVRQSATHSTDQYASFVMDFLQASNRLPQNVHELGTFLEDPELGDVYDFVEGRHQHGFTIICKIDAASSVVAQYLIKSNRAIRVSATIHQPYEQSK